MSRDRPPWEPYLPPRPDSPPPQPEPPAGSSSRGGAGAARAPPAGPGPGNASQGYPKVVAGRPAADFAGTPIPIDKAMADERLLGAALGPIGTWSTWLAVLKAAFALELTKDELALFAAVAGGRKPPSSRARELWAMVGRRGGKSRVAAALAVFFALLVKHKVAPGERPTCLVVAASQDQAQTVFGYVLGFLRASPILRREIVGVTKSEVVLRNGTTIAIHACSFRSIRGRTLLCAVFDEIAYWRTEDSTTPDTEVYSAVLPSLVTTGGMLVAISTTYRKVGLCYTKHRDHFGIDSDDTLVVQGSSRQFNGTLNEAAIAAQRAADPTAAPSEWDAEFRTDVSAFIDDRLIDAAVDYGRGMTDLPPFSGTFYQAWVDPAGGASGGGADAYTLAIAHRAHGQHGKYIIAAIRGTRPGEPYNPRKITEDYADLCKTYRITSVIGDGYSAEWVRSAWAEARPSMHYIRSEIFKSQIYLQTAPLFSRGLVSLPDHPRLLRELRQLERRAHRSGRDTVDHGRGGHDDFANCVCGVLHSLAAHLGGIDYSGFSDIEPAPPVPLQRWAGMTEERWRQITSPPPVPRDLREMFDGAQQ